MKTDQTPAADISHVVRLLEMLGVQPFPENVLRAHWKIAARELPASAPKAEGVTECRECGSRDVEWEVSYTSNSGVVEGRLRTNDVRCLFVLGCNSCSETLVVIPAEDACANYATLTRELPAASLGADALDAAKWRYTQQPGYYSTGPYNRDGESCGVTVGVQKDKNDSLNSSCQGRGNTLDEAITKALALAPAPSSAREGDALVPYSVARKLLGDAYNAHPDGFGVQVMELFDAIVPKPEAGAVGEVEITDAMIKRAADSAWYGAYFSDEDRALKMAAARRILTAAFARAQGDKP